MSEHKGDELSATGSHRAWTGETAGPAVRAGAPRDPQRNWLERAHVPTAPTLSREPAPRGDHALVEQLVELQELDRQGPQQLGQGQERQVSRSIDAVSRS